MIIQRRKRPIVEAEQTQPTKTYTKPKLVKSPENAERAERRRIEEAETAQRAKLAMVMGAPPDIFYDAGLRRFLSGAINPKKPGAVKTKAALADAIGMSRGWIYQILSPTNPHRVGKKTLKKLRDFTRLPLAVRNQFYLEGIAKIGKDD